jgi:Raf kinase inhibitor-like YbhB/YbcL family protein
MTSTSPRPPLPHDHFLPDLSGFSLASDDIDADASLPIPQLSGVFGAGGEDLSPHLSWHGFPATTKSFVLTVFDPDAPTGSGFWHWAVHGIPASVTEVPAGAGTPDTALLPPQAQTLRNDAGIRGFLGAAPPEGDGPHRYVFSVLALDTETLPVSADATPALLGFYARGHAVARAVLVATCER